MGNLPLRPLVQGDAPALLAFYNGLSQATIRTFRPLGLHTSLQVCEQIVAENGAAPASRFDLVACDHDAIIGWAFITGLNTPHPDLGIAVADHCQGQGIGTALISQVIVKAKMCDLTAIYLMVVQDNYRAIRFYKRYGFRAYEQEFDEIDQLLYFHMVKEN